MSAKRTGILYIITNTHLPMSARFFVYSEAALKIELKINL